MKDQIQEGCADTATDNQEETDRYAIGGVLLMYGGKSDSTTQWLVPYCATHPL